MRITYADGGPVSAPGSLCSDLRTLGGLPNVQLALSRSPRIERARPDTWKNRGSIVVELSRDVLNGSITRSVRLILSCISFCRTAKLNRVRLSFFFSSTVTVRLYKH